MIRTLTVLTALLVLAIEWNAVEAVEKATAPPSAVPWSALRFQAEKMAGRITAEVWIEPEQAASLPPGRWPAVKGEPLRPAGPTLLKLSIRLKIEPPGMEPLRMENQLWFDSQSGAPLRLIRTRAGIDDYVQWFVFGREQVFRRQHEPGSPGQTNGPPESWTRVSERAYAFRAEGCPRPAETSMLVYLLSDAVARGALDLGPRCVFHKRQLHRLSFRTERQELVPYDYLERSGGESRRRTGAGDAVTVRIESTPVGTYEGSVEPWFKDGFLTFSADGRLPLVVACDLPVVGHVELRLDEVRWHYPQKGAGEEKRRAGTDSASGVSLASRPIGSYRFTK